MNAFQHYADALERHPMRLAPSTAPSTSGTLRERNNRIIYLLGRRPYTVTEIADEMTQCRRQMRTILARMERDGSVVRIAGNVETWRLA